MPNIDKCIELVKDLWRIEKDGCIYSNRTNHETMAIYNLKGRMIHSQLDYLDAKRIMEQHNDVINLIIMSEYKQGN